MRSASGGPRVLLRRLRETMAEQVSAQERLDKIVVLIAANMVAEVCSTYVLRVDNTLELYATEGLNRDAVHHTVLSAHEGLVGLVASEATPLNLNDAQSHPAFSFRPETGEEIYHSFLGVPILRAGNTLGVLVVQNRAKRTYVEEEVEALQTTAMVLAERIASGELSALAQPGAEPAARHSLHKTGAILSDGIALGHVVLHEPRVVITNYIAEDLPKEIKRLDAALTKLRADLDRMLERGDVADGGEHRDVLEAYRMFANDHGWSHKLHEAAATGLTAEAAVERVQSDTRARMLRSTDPYLRDRLHDLEDLGHRLMRQLVGQDHAPSREQLPDNAILIARARAGAGRRYRQFPRLDRGARARHPRGRRNTERAGHRRSGRCHHRRRPLGLDLCPALGGDRAGLCGTGAVSRAAPGTIFGAARQALRHQGWPARRIDDQCGPDHRSAPYRRHRQRRHRPVPHRTAIHGRPEPAAHQRPAGAVPHRARCRGPQAGDVPDARHWRRQGAALYGDRDRGKPGARLARDPSRTRPARPVARPDPRAAAGRRRAGAAHHVSDDLRSRRVRRRQGDRRAGADLSASARPFAAGAHRRRDDGRGSGAALSARRAFEESRFRFRGIQRSVSIPVCGRSRQRQGVRTVRHHVRPDPAGAARDRAEGECGEKIRLALRRDGVKTARRAGTDCARIPLAVVVAAQPRIPRPGPLRVEAHSIRKAGIYSC